MAAITATNYKCCPLKKRPIVYEADEKKEEVLETSNKRPREEDAEHHLLAKRPCSEETQVVEKKEHLLVKRPRVVLEPQNELSLLAKRVRIEEPQEAVYPGGYVSGVELLSKYYELLREQEHPQDLSLKRTSSDSPAQLELEKGLAAHIERTASYLSACSSMLSPIEQPTTSPVALDLHLRGLTAAPVAVAASSYNSHSTYQSAFALAAGCAPIAALWPSYQPHNTTGIFPSPASSVDISPCSSFGSSASIGSASYTHITPPSSPNSEAVSEPEDLSVRSDIPLPALFHHFGESAPKNSGKKTPKPSHSDSELSASKNYRFKCDKCNKMYSTSIGLSKHQQYHCPAAECNQQKKQHSCEECGKLYTTIGALKMHIRTHTLPCKCPICGKAFSRPWLLQGHIRTHTGEKPFKCEDCPRSFADRSNLRAHQQTHVDVKKYVCKMCNKSFSRMSLLNKHVNSNCTITIA